MSEDRLAEPELEAAEVEITEAEPTPVEAPETPEPVVEEEVKPVPTVPLSALNEARHQMRELKAQLAEEAKQREELKRMFDEQRAQKQQEQTKAQFQTDPLGALHNDIKALKEQQEQAQTRAQQEASQRQQMAAMEQQVAAQVNEFRKSAPDYADALNHVLESRAQELRMYGVPDTQIQQAIDIETTQLAQQALAQGRNPAELVYELAKLRGYTTKKAEASKKAPSLEVIERGQRASTSLSDASGSAPDADRLIFDDSIDDETFDKEWAKRFGKKAR